jgi:hypothetical protein
MSRYDPHIDSLVVNLALHETDGERDVREEEHIGYDTLRLQYRQSGMRVETRRRV